MRRGMYVLRPEAFIIIMGIGQGLVLLKYVKAAWKWLLPSLVAAVVLFITYYAEIKDGKFPYLAPLINWPIVAFLLAVGQAHCLRHFRKKKAVDRKT